MVLSCWLLSRVVAAKSVQVLSKVTWLGRLVAEFLERLRCSLWVSHSTYRYTSRFHMDHRKPQTSRMSLMEASTTLALTNSSSTLLKVRHRRGSQVRNSPNSWVLWKWRLAQFLSSISSTSFSPIVFPLLSVSLAFLASLKREYLISSYSPYSMSSSLNVFQHFSLLFREYRIRLVTNYSYLPWFSTP